jgi:prophage regulatory protein
MNVLGFRDLRKKGIPFTRQHIHKLIRNKRFPRPIKIGGGTNAWPEQEIDNYLEDCIAKRDTAASRAP